MTPREFFKMIQVRERAIQRMKDSVKVGPTPTGMISIELSMYRYRQDTKRYKRELEEGRLY